jgi:hypothetical protein
MSKSKDRPFPSMTRDGQPLKKSPVPPPPDPKTPPPPPIQVDDRLVFPPNINP